MHLWTDQVVPLLAVALVLAIGVGLATLNLRDRAIRAFSALLILRSLVGATIVFAGLADTPIEADFWWRIHPYLIFPLAPAAIYFAAVFPVRRGGPTASRGLFWLLAAVTVGVEALYVADHSLFWDLPSRPGGAGHPALTAVVGPLYTFQFLFVAAYALIVHSCAEGFVAGGPQRAKVSALIVGLGFGLVVVYDALSFLTIEGEATWRHGGGIALTLAALLVLSLALIALAALKVLGHAATSGDPEDRWLARRFGSALLLPPLSLAGVAITSGSPGISLSLAQAFGSMWRLALPILVAYGLARHHIFDIDLRVKWTIGKGTLAAIFLGVFLVVGQIAQNYLQTEYGWLIGGVATGLLLFALSPLQLFAERVADAAMPRTKPMAEMDHGERLTVYRDTARVVWADGAIDRNERVMLDRLRETLRLSREEASIIESEAAGVPETRRDETSQSAT